MAGTVHMHPDAKIGAHRHGHWESVSYGGDWKDCVCVGESHWSLSLKLCPGILFTYRPMPPIRKSTPNLECVLVRNDRDPLVVNPKY